MNKLKLVLFLFFLGLCSTAHAVGSGEFNILKVEVTETFFTVYSASGTVISDDCQDGSKIIFWRADYPKGYESMLSTALAAHMGKKKVSMWFNGCKMGAWNQMLPKPESIVVL